MNGCLDDRGIVFVKCSTALCTHCTAPLCTEIRNIFRISYRPLQPPNLFSTKFYFSRKFGFTISGFLEHQIVQDRYLPKLIQKKLKLNVVFFPRVNIDPISDRMDKKTRQVKYENYFFLLLVSVYINQCHHLGDDTYSPLWSVSPPPLDLSRPRDYFSQ